MGHLSEITPEFLVTEIPKAMIEVDINEVT